MKFRLGLYIVAAALWLTAAFYVFYSPRFEVWGKQRWSAGVLALALMLWNLVRAWLAWQTLRARYADDNRASTPVDY